MLVLSMVVFASHTTCSMSHPSCTQGAAVEEDALFLIVDGTASVKIHEKEVQTISLKEGSDASHFGELFLLEDLRRPATVTALDRVTVLVLTRSKFNNLIIGCGVGADALAKMRESAAAAADKERLEAELAEEEARVQRQEANEAQQIWERKKKNMHQCEQKLAAAKLSLEDAHLTDAASEILKSCSDTVAVASAALTQAISATEMCVALDIQ
eukprot:SAG31_NODE_13910_length_838_cov_1.078484_1_plen_213_part_00